MNPLYHGTPEDTKVYNTLEVLTDRELQEKQAFILRAIYKNSERIKLNLQFWFYFTIASIVIGFLILVNQ